MNTPQHIAKNLREIYFGGNWTDVNLKDQLTDLTWQQATTQVYTFNTIASLVYHMTYYVENVSCVLDGKPLESKDADSFDHQPVRCKEDWDALTSWAATTVESFAQKIENLPEEQMNETFVKEKYGTYYRNLQGIIEHAHYHLGQIVLIKKILESEEV